MSTIKIGRDVDANEKDNTFITCQWKSEIGSTNWTENFDDNDGFHENDETLLYLKISR